MIENGCYFPYYPVCNIAKKRKMPEKYQVWIDARKRYHLSHAHVQMARELGMNPKKFGKLANYKQEPWKTPLPIFIEKCYLKRFRKQRPDVVKPVEEVFKERKEKKEERKQRKLQKTQEIKDGNYNTL